MPWNWELPDWPHFSFDLEKLLPLEKKFLLNVGSASAYIKSVSEDERDQFIIEVLSWEGAENAKIEGEILDRASLQSSIKKHFGLKTSGGKEKEHESRMAKVLCDAYASFDKPLTVSMLKKWHRWLFEGATHITDWGSFRTHLEAMQIVGNQRGRPHIFFEAPPSKLIPREMIRFLQWFNSAIPTTTLLSRAALAHVYFESIHPFEDGNGRLGRVIVEKMLSQGVGRPILIATSKILEKKKKAYYAALGRCNKTLDVQDFVEFFATSILEGQQESLQLLIFLMEKNRLLTRLTGQINSRQEKVLLRLFAAGPEGFLGGLSSENYVSITKTSKATATRDLTDLVQKGALVKSGVLRHTRYRLNI